MTFKMTIHEVHVGDSEFVYAYRRRMEDGLDV